MNILMYVMYVCYMYIYIHVIYLCMYVRMNVVCLYMRILPVATADSRSDKATFHIHDNDVFDLGY